MGLLVVITRTSYQRHFSCTDHAFVLFAVVLEPAPHSTMSPGTKSANFLQASGRTSNFAKWGYLIPAAYPNVHRKSFNFKLPSGAWQRKFVWSWECGMHIQRDFQSNMFVLQVFVLSSACRKIFPISDTIHKFLYLLDKQMQTLVLASLHFLQWLILKLSERCCGSHFQITHWCLLRS